MTTSNRLGITELAASQVDRSVTINEAIAKLEAGATFFAAIQVLLNAPPGSPAEGDLYVVGTAGTGAWSGHNNNVTVYYNAAWIFFAPFEGMFAWDQMSNSLKRYDGADWVGYTVGAGAIADGDYGDITVSSTGSVWTIDASAVTNAKLANMAQSTIKGRAASAGTGAPTDLSVAQVVAIIGDTDGTLAANSDSVVATQKATKTYVDAKVAGLSWKQAVRAATTANGTLASAYENGDTIDGVVLATGDRILIKNQSTASENGIYTVNASGAPTRATDADSGAELVNASVYVSEGTTNADTQWTCTTNATITVGSTSLAFAQLTSAGGSVPTSRVLTSGAGLTGGGDLSADRTLAVGAGTGITVNADDVQIASAYQAVGVQTFYVPAVAMVADPTNGPSTGTVQPTSHGVIFPTLDFDASTIEYAQFQVRMPKGWNESTLTFSYTWSHASTSTNFTAIFKMDAVACSDDDAGDATFGTAQSVTDTGGTTNDIYMSAASSALTVGGSPAAEDLVIFRIYRDASNGSDTLAIDARLHGVTVYYTIDAANDA